MGYIRERYDLFNSIEIREHMDCRHQEEGTRCEKRKRTPEEMKRANQRRKEEKARRLIWANFEPGDYVRTLTFKKDRRPADMKEAQSIKAKFLRQLAREYGKRFYKLLWIANIECPPRGAWHIHLICNRIEGGGDIIKDLWRQYGGVYDQELADIQGKDIGAYITKSPDSADDGEHKVIESKYSHSRNLTVPEPKRTEISGWRMSDAPRVPKGFYLDKDSMYEGVNMAGYQYRTYIIRRLVPKPRNRRTKGKKDESRHLYRKRQPAAKKRRQVDRIPDLC
jgi:hypothetical protein